MNIAPRINTFGNFANYGSRTEPDGGRQELVLPACHRNDTPFPKSTVPDLRHRGG